MYYKFMKMLAPLRSTFEREKFFLILNFEAIQSRSMKKRYTNKNDLSVKIYIYLLTVQYSPRGTQGCCILFTLPIEV